MTSDEDIIESAKGGMPANLMISCGEPLNHEDRTVVWLDWESRILIVIKILYHNNLYLTCSTNFISNSKDLCSFFRHSKLYPKPAFVTCQVNVIDCLNDWTCDVLCLSVLMFFFSVIPKHSKITFLSNCSMFFPHYMPDYTTPHTTEK